jgi:rhodanese-related sulfurtransferase
MEVISLKELKAKIDRGDKFKLVMTMGAWVFESQHIPGSINVSNPEEAARSLSKDDEIVVYCSNPACYASQWAYKLLKEKGFKNVRRFSGGLSEWYDAGYPLEGRDAG